MLFIEARPEKWQSTGGAPFSFIHQCSIPTDVCTVHNEAASVDNYNGIAMPKICRTAESMSVITSRRSMKGRRGAAVGPSISARNENGLSSTQ